MQLLLEESHTPTTDREYNLSLSNTRGIFSLWLPLPIFLPAALAAGVLNDLPAVASVVFLQIVRAWYLGFGTLPLVPPVELWFVANGANEIGQKFYYGIIFFKQKTTFFRFSCTKLERSRRRLQKAISFNFYF